MRHERSLRVFIGLCVMGLTVGTVGTLGGWAVPEPPSDHGTPAKPAPAKSAKPEAKPETKSEAKPEAKTEGRPAAADPKPTGRLEPVWGEAKSSARSAARAESARPQAEPDSRAAPAPVSDPATRPTADAALQSLQAGNARWVSGQMESPNVSESRRRAVAESGQNPVATILTCADSRIPVERVFDQGIGDLFVVRVAGNVAGEHEAGTIEYGVEHLHVPLLVVMGHTRCGAVTAAATRSVAPGNVASLIEAIAPAVDRAESLNPSLRDGDLVAAAIRENVWQSVFDLIRSSEACRESIRSGQLRVVGAVYDLSSGRVEWLGEHPWQRELIAAMDARAAARAVTAPPAARQAEAPESH